MEVKPGYKQTEVGVIPEEWEVVTATDACELVVDCKNRTPPVVPDSDFAVVRTPNVRNGQFVLDELRFTDEESYRVWTSRAVPQLGDIMITREAPLGEVCAVPPNRKVCLGQRMMLYRPSPDRTSSNFLLYSLMSEPVRENLFRKIGGSTVGHAKVDDIRFLQVPLPPLPEQRAIAEALSDVDGLLGGLDRLIAKKRDLKQAAMQQLLTGQTRLPGFHGDWEVKRLGDFGKCLRGVSYKGDSDLSTHDTPHTKRLLRSNNVQNAVVVTDEVQFVSGARVSAHQILQQDDILICMANGSKALVGKAGIFMLSDGHEYTFGAFMGCFRTNATESNPAFVFYLFLTARYRDYINNLLAGSSINNLRPSSIESLEFSTPPHPEQTAIASVLSEMDGELAVLEQRREKTRALKQAMMQELLTGRTRLV